MAVIQVGNCLAEPHRGEATCQSLLSRLRQRETDYHRFGKFSDALAKIRARIEREPMERDQLRSLCWDLGLPGDFDIAQINWQPATMLFSSANSPSEHGDFTFSGASTSWNWRVVWH